MKYFIFFLISVSFFCLSCKDNKQKETIGVLPFFQKTALQQIYPDFEEKIITDSLSKVLTDSTFVGRFYREENYNPLWIKKDMIESAQIDSLLAQIKNSETHGLNPDYFRYNEMLSLFDTIKIGKYANEPAKLYSLLTKLEYLATKAVVDYSTGLKYGFVDPKKVFKSNYFLAYQQPDSAHYQYLAENLKNWSSIIAEAEPKDPVYSQFREELKYYNSFAKDSFALIQAKTGKATYTINEENPNIPLIAKRLMLTGEVPVTDKADSIYSSLTPELMEAINQFRKKNSYPVEEEVGKVTIDALNRPISYYKKTIQTNLERLRWKKVNPYPEKCLKVNVAGFYLEGIEPNRNATVMNVCVGGSPNNQTPFLESSITTINLNPTWSIPSSIIQKETYWHIKKDPNYLQRNRMKLLKRNGEVVDASSINWDEVNPKNFSYAIRQDPGSGNSLGRIKFLFNNPFAVYLHDTPSQRAFTYKNRAVSHGCVRVQKPMDLAFFCLEEKDSLYFDRILYSVDRSPISKEGKQLLSEKQLKRVDNIINLKKGIPLYIEYFTFYALSDKQTYFADDVYNLDKTIRQKLMIE